MTPNLKLIWKIPTPKGSNFTNFQQNWTVAFWAIAKKPKKYYINFFFRYIKIENTINKCSSWIHQELKNVICSPKFPKNNFRPYLVKVLAKPISPRRTRHQKKFASMKITLLDGRFYINVKIAPKWSLIGSGAIAPKSAKK